MLLDSEISSSEWDNVASNERGFLSMVDKQGCAVLRMVHVRCNATGPWLSYASGMPTMSSLALHGCCPNI